MAKKIGKLTIPQSLYPMEHRTKARQAWTHMNNRCNKPEDPRYKWYGAKGVKIEISRDEFIHWYCQELARWNGSLREATIGRINHSDSYRLGNMEVQSNTDNIREMHSRNPQVHLSHTKAAEANRKQVLVRDAKTKEPICICVSGVQAAMVTNSDKANVSTICLKRGRLRTLDGGRFTVEFY